MKISNRYNTLVSAVALTVVTGFFQVANALDADEVELIKLSNGIELVKINNDINDDGEDNDWQRTDESDMRTFYFEYKVKNNTIILETNATNQSAYMKINIKYKRVYESDDRNDWTKLEVKGKSVKVITLTD